ncbi:hypothetical protein SDJN02_03385, partial [Cucurbita argyrosperma subsp. argyrosperma]
METLSLSLSVSSSLSVRAFDSRNACKLASVLTLGNPPENSKWDSLVFLSSSALNEIEKETPLETLSSFIVFFFEEVK